MTEEKRKYLLTLLSAWRLLGTMLHDKGRVYDITEQLQLDEITFAMELDSFENPAADMLSKTEIMTCINFADVAEVTCNDFNLVKYVKPGTYELTSPPAGPNRLTVTKTGRVLFSASDIPALKRMREDIDLCISKILENHSADLREDLAARDPERPAP